MLKHEVVEIFEEVSNINKLKKEAKAGVMIGGTNRSLDDALEECLNNFMLLLVEDKKKRDAVKHYRW